MMRLVFLILMTQVLTCLRIFGEEVRSITIQDAVNLAVSQNPAVRAARNELEAARWRIDIAKSAKYPQVLMSAQYLHTDALGTFTIPSLGPNIPLRTISIGAADNTIGILRVQQALYTAGRIPAQIKRAVALYDVALGRLAAVQAQIVLEAKEAYYNVLLSESLVRSAEQNLVAAKQHLEVATAKFEAGSAPRFDVIRAKTQVSEAEQNLTQARNQAQLARITLNKVLGAPLNQVFNLSEPKPPSPPAKDISSLIETALSQRPEVLIAKAQIAAAEAGVRAAKADERPQLGLDADYQVVSNENPGQASGFTLAAVLTKEIFDGGRIKAAISEAKAMLDEARSRFEQTKFEVELEIRQSYLNLETAQKTLETAKARLAQAEEAYEIAQVRYDAGVGTAVEIADALAALAAARTNLDQANYDYNIAYAKLQKALGNPSGA